MLIPYRDWSDSKGVLDISETFCQIRPMKTSISPEEAADRVAIRELVQAYAHCADRRDAKGQMALFTPDTHFVVFMHAKDPMPSQHLHSRDTLAPAFADLRQHPSP